MLGLVLFLRWGRGAVGSAPRWHRGGRGFESHRLHHLKKPKNLPSKTANCCQHCCQLSIFPLAFKQESFRLAEEKRIWPITLSSRASTQATADFRSSMCSSLRIIVRLLSKGRPTVSLGPVAPSPLRLTSAQMSPTHTLPYP